MAVNAFKISSKKMWSRDGKRRTYLSARVKASGADFYTTEVRFAADQLDDGKTAAHELVKFVMDKLVATIEKVAPSLMDSFWDEVAQTVEGRSDPWYKLVDDYMENLPEGV